MSVMRLLTLLCNTRHTISFNTIVLNIFKISIETNTSRCGLSDALQCLSAPPLQGGQGGISPPGSEGTETFPPGFPPWIQGWRQLRGEFPPWLEAAEGDSPLTSWELDDFSSICKGKSALQFHKTQKFSPAALILEGKYSFVALLNHQIFACSAHFTR